MLRMLVYDIVSKRDESVERGSLGTRAPVDLFSYLLHSTTVSVSTSYMYSLLLIRILSSDSLHGLSCALAYSSSFFLAKRVLCAKSSRIDKREPFSFLAEARMFCLSLNVTILAIIGLHLS